MPAIHLHSVSARLPPILSRAWEAFQTPSRLAAVCLPSPTAAGHDEPADVCQPDARCMHRPVGSGGRDLSRHPARDSLESTPETAAPRLYAEPSPFPMPSPRE
ncbi:hypothetical protein CDD83_8050 [Cordyceps sp. RAO-2017]|nr:hypothetical protein CDD83_8050 [Cordyceps sp. RAO-2017]